MHMSLLAFPHPPTSISKGNNPCLCEHLQARPGRLGLPFSFLAPSVLAALVHLGNANCQRSCFAGRGRCVRCGFLSSSTARSPSHFLKTLTTHCWIQVVEQTQFESESHTNSVLVQLVQKDRFDPFLWLRIRTTGMKDFPYLGVTDRLFAFGKY